jgi:hypothetical protein
MLTDAVVRHELCAMQRSSFLYCEFAW